MQLRNHQPEVPDDCVVTRNFKLWNISGSLYSAPTVEHFFAKKELRLSYMHFYKSTVNSTPFLVLISYFFFTFRSLTRTLFCKYSVSAVTRMFSKRSTSMTMVSRIYVESFGELEAVFPSLTSPPLSLSLSLCLMIQVSTLAGTKLSSLFWKLPILPWSALL